MLRRTWSQYSYTTLVINVEFKSRFPYTNVPEGFAPRTVGLYSASRFMQEGLFDSHCPMEGRLDWVGRRHAMQSHANAHEKAPYNSLGLQPCS